MKLVPHSKAIKKRIRQLMREAVQLYGKNMDNRIIDHVQEHMIKEGLRGKVPLMQR